MGINTYVNLYCRLSDDENLYCFYWLKDVKCFSIKKTEANQLLIKHLDIVKECLNSASKTIQMYLKGDTKEAKSLTKQVDTTESQADLVFDQ